MTQVNVGSMPRNDESTGLSSIQNQDGMLAVAQSRAAQEVQAMMVISKRFPRDETESYTRIMRACKRKELAKSSMYAYPKGGTMVTGPSIRLAEVLAQNWGNIDFGIIELEQRMGESSVMAYAWDTETNTRQTKIFTIKHAIQKKDGSVKRLTDPRDVYEMVANQGARRLRACILGVIPGDIVDAAMGECETTLKSADKTPLVDRIRKMAVAFSEMAITQDTLEARLGHSLDVTTDIEIVLMTKIYQSIRDNMSSREDWFSVSAQETSGSRTENLAAKLTKKKETPADAEPNSSSPPKPEAEVNPLLTKDELGLGDLKVKCENLLQNVSRIDMRKEKTRQFVWPKEETIAGYERARAILGKLCDKVADMKNKQIIDTAFDEFLSASIEAVDAEAK